MRTRAEARKERKAIQRETDRALKAAARAKMVELRAALQAARAERKTRVKRAREACASTRRLITQRARERARRLREELRATLRLERVAARERCTAGKKRAKDEGCSAVRLAARTLAEEQKYQRDLRRIERNNRRQTWHVKTATRAERRSESDGEVVANLPPELVPLWRKVGARIRGSTRQSRTEAFLRYAEEHPNEVIAAHEDGIDAKIREMERRMNEAQRVARGQRRRYTAAELAAVPF